MYLQKEKKADLPILCPIASNLNYGLTTGTLQL